MRDKNSPSLTVPKSSSTALILAIVFGAIAVILGGLSIWLGINYTDQKNNVDAIADTRVAEAIKKQAEKLELEFSEREKQPFVQFTGPEDFGRLVFSYPKTWSMFVEKNQIPYIAYLNPKFIHPISSDSRYALRVVIQDRMYEDVVAAYNNQVKKGLASSAININDSVGTRFDGELTSKIIGSAVIFKIRDKTVTLQTDAEVFRPDFEQIIKTITFNK